MRRLILGLLVLAAGLWLAAGILTIQSRRELRQRLIEAGTDTDCALADAQ